MANLPEIIKNIDDVYEGDLKHYFQVVMTSAKNLKNPYHNFRHMFHVTWLCYDACVFYKDIMSPKQMRNLLIAAMFHDFDHPGRSGNDDLNIEISIRGLTKNIHPYDEQDLELIASMIRTTQFPHIVSADHLSLEEAILRDADLSQGLSPVWVQEIIFGLSSEMCVSPIDVFKMQAGFFTNLKFISEWGKQKFNQNIVDEKIKEANDYLELLS
jgi:hypothetical protein